MMNNPATKGRGFIYIPEALWDDLGKPETPEAWHKVLLLPVMYEIENIVLKGERFEIEVLHEAIPVENNHITKTHVTPSYYHEFDEASGTYKEFVLKRIDISQWDGARWNTVAVTDQRPEE